MPEQSRPFRLGVTGGIGCGKSTCGQFLQELGWHVIDTDNIARELLLKDPEIIGAIKSHWPSCANPDGSINRRLLGDIVFNDVSQREILNAIVHPAVRSTWQSKRQNLESSGKRTAVIIPLLHEVGIEDEFDSVLCVGCSEQTQLTRLNQRGWSKEHSLQRIRSQLPLVEKIARSTYLIWNEDDITHLKLQTFILRKIQLIFIPFDSS